MKNIFFNKDISRNLDKYIFSEAESQSLIRVGSMKNERRENWRNTGAAVE